MFNRCLRGFFVPVVLGSVATIGGCGSSSEEGTMVKVDKKQEEVMLKKMEEYMQKNMKAQQRGEGQIRIRPESTKGRARAEIGKMGMANRPPCRHNVRDSEA